MPSAVQRSLLSLGTGGFHHLAYREWPGERDARTLVCVHGLTRNGRDFDVLAESFAPAWRVVCPDIVGRGDSARLADARQYGYPQYCADMAALLARLDVEAVDWIGTSMGGLIGMLVAARPNAPIRRLVLNDIGPVVPKAGLERIATYVGKDPRFPDRAAVEAYFRAVMAGWGALEPAHWAHVVEHGAEPAPEGGFRLRYDPAIGDAFKGELVELDLWAAWDAIRCPVLVLRGAESDLLAAATAAEMTRRGPKVLVIELSGIGHAPSLMAQDQIAAVRAWLDDESRP